MSNSVVDVQKLGRSYKMGESATVNALKKIDFQVQEGEMVAIMGPSGSGKSTLLHILGCLDRPSTGSYFLNGQKVTEMSDNALSQVRSTQIGFVFQSFNLLPELTVEQNVSLPFSYHTKKPAQEVISKAIERVGLAHRKRHLPTELSGGEMQRTSIARAIAIDPLIILADEPTGNLDRETSSSILTLFRELNAQGATVILITHDAFVAKHCKRLIEMRDGEIIRDEIL